MRTFFFLILRTALSAFFAREHFPPASAGLNAFRPWIKGFWFQKILRFNAKVRWPMSPTCHISDLKRIHFPIGEVHNFLSPGTYYQNFLADIYLGSNVYIGPNVGLITVNHNPDNISQHLEGADIHIANKCWLGMNVVILPGVALGEGTVVAAGAVVTTSFERGHCVIGGVPARVIKTT